MDPRKLLEESVRASLKKRGFRKRGATWRSDKAETILVLNIQKSQWGPQFYVNLGVFLRALGDSAASPENKCHLQARLGQVLDDSFLLEKALNFESDMEDAERTRVVQELVEAGAIPWLEARDSEAKARDSLLHEERPSGMVMIAAKKHLGVSAV